MTLPARTELLAKGGGDGHNGCGSIHCGDGDEPARAVPNVIVQEKKTIALAADAAIQVAVDAVMVMVCLYFQVQWQAAARHQLQQQRQQGNGG